MRRISWLHISDIHISVRDAWSQDVVLRAMCERIRQLRSEGLEADFILATGDLAFSGKADEYALVTDFFDAVSDASGISKQRIFCVPGNHDIDRDRHKLCFQGGRSSLSNPNLVDALLVPGEDLSTLLKRQENYREFQSSYFKGQKRQSTKEGLAYVSRLSIEDVRIAIVGLDSAWLAEGGLSDHGKLLIGERQVINALRLAQECEDAPHIVLCLAHHPCHLLAEFDRQPVLRRIERASHFFHCGHLHVPEMRAVGRSGTGCLSVSAGASYETRQSHNAFAVVTLDLLQAKRVVRTIQYEPTAGVFSPESSQEFEVEVAARETCSVAELATAIGAYRPALQDYAHFLSALLLEQKAEVPVLAAKGYVFAAFAALASQGASDLRTKTTDFMAFKNVLRVLYKRIPMPQMLAQHGELIAAYGSLLEKLGQADEALRDRLAEQEQESRSLAGTEVRTPFSHTEKLLTELADAHEWEELRKQASRHVNAPAEHLAVHAQRMMALGLAQSEDGEDKRAAIELYRSLGNGLDATPGDLRNLATLLINEGRPHEAKDVVMLGINTFSAHKREFADIGHRVIEATGDNNFRKKMEEALEKRGLR